MDFQPTTFTIDKIVRWIDTGKLALPDFQRDFVWSPGKVAELLDSVSRGWPIGSLLLLDGPQPFKPKGIDSGPGLRGNVQIYVLDGQQRVTALYHAVADVSPVVYYIDFNALEKGDEHVRWQKRAEFESEVPSIADQAMRRIAKVSDVYDSTRFHEWQQHLQPALGSQMVALRNTRLPGLQSNVYKLVGVSLDQEIALEALARIFETINRAGVRLNAFDLMVAVLYPHDFDLRSEWETALVENPLLETFDVDGLEILKLISLLERRDQKADGQRVTAKGVRQGDVLEIPPSRVREDWHRAVMAYTRALEFAQHRLGVGDERSVPSSAMLLTLAFALDSGCSISKVRQWFWWSVVNQTYAQGANTRVVSDADLLQTDGNLAVPWCMMEQHLLERVLLEPIRRNRILARGIGCLLSARGAKDPISGDSLAKTKNIAFVTPTALVAGKAYPDADSPIAAQVYLDSTSAKSGAVQGRKRQSLDGLLLEEGLESQGFLSQAVFGPEDKAALERRAATLASWLINEPLREGE